MTRLSHLKCHPFRVALLFVALVANASAAVLPIPAPPQLAAKSYLVLDADTGQIIAESNSADRVEPASLTKMMTAYLVSNEIVYRGLKPDETVLISKRAHAAIGSRTFLEPGSKVTVRDLMYGLVVQSGNDASIALAEHVAGSEEDFVSMMNQTAVQLGMKATSFANSTGLPHPDHYSTAQDLAVLARAVVRDHPDHYRLYSVKEFTHNEITQKNRNKLLLRDPTVDGIKTGHTSAAGYCLVASAKRGNMRLISVLLGARSEETRSSESLRALHYGFRFFENAQLSEAGKVLGTVRVWGGLVDEVPMGIDETRVITLRSGQKQTAKKEFDITPNLVAPVKRGQPIGKMLYFVEGELSAEMPVVALDDIQRGGFFKRSIDSMKRMLR